MLRNCIIISFIVLSFCQNNTSAQSPDINEIINELNTPTLFGEIVDYHKPTAGSRFFIDGWTKGDIFLKNGDIASNRMLQYNGYTDQLYWLNISSNNIIALDKPIIKKFTLADPNNDETYIFKNIKVISANSSDTSEIFAQEVVEDKYSLFVSRRIEQTGRTNIRQNNRLIEVPVLQPRPVYYLKLPDDGFVKFTRLRNSVMYDLIPGKEEKIRNLFSDHRIRIRNESDLIDAVRIMNKL